MPVWSRREFLRTACAVAAAGLLGPLQAEEMLRVKQFDLQARADHYVLTGGYDVQLTPTLQEALRKGVGLTFVLLFELDRPRDYWFAENIAVVRRNLRLTYNALLRQYQLQRGDAHLSFDTLSEALTALGDFADWPVVERRLVARKRLYDARIRLYLDTSRLAKPLQINAFASDRWDMDSGWREWTFKP